MSLRNQLGLLLATALIGGLQLTAAGTAHAEGVKPCGTEGGGTCDPNYGGNDIDTSQPPPQYPGTGSTVGNTGGGTTNTPPKTSTPPKTYTPPKTPAHVVTEPKVIPGPTPDELKRIEAQAAADKKAAEEKAAKEAADKQAKADADAKAAAEAQAAADKAQADAGAADEAKKLAGEKAADEPDNKIYLGVAGASALLLSLVAFLLWRRKRA